MGVGVDVTKGAGVDSTVGEGIGEGLGSKVGVTGGTNKVGSGVDVSDGIGTAKGAGVNTAEEISVNTSTASIRAALTSIFTLILGAPKAKWVQQKLSFHVHEINTNTVEAFSAYEQEKCCQQCRELKSGCQPKRSANLACSRHCDGVGKAAYARYARRHRAR